MNSNDNQFESIFFSNGVKCAGTLYLPNQTDIKPGVIILGHGFGAESSLGLPAFAERFINAGFAAYTFDYRCFGNSEGEPRHWVSPKRHLADWRAAIKHVRTLSEIDPEKVVIWGTSFGGGHVLKIASENPPILAVISQVPHVDGMATLALMRPGDIVKGLVAGIRDILGSAIFNKPHYSPVVAKPGVFAAMNSATSWDGWQALLPEDSKWENKVLSRIFLEVSSYSPTKSVQKINVPTLIIAAETDTVAPCKAAQKAANKIVDSEFHLLKCEHFDPYVGEFFEQNIKIQLNFLERFLHNPT